MSDKLEMMKCHHCGHQWEPRVKKPKKCPQCQNPLWVSPRPKRKKGMLTKEEVVQMLTVPSEEAVPTPPTTDTNTPESPYDVPGADESLKELAENLGPSQPVYSEVMIDTNPEPLTKRLQREADERLRRLADE